jgi:hypothetical protein
MKGTPRAVSWSVARSLALPAWFAEPEDAPRPVVVAEDVGGEEGLRKLPLELGDQGAHGGP